MTTSMRIMFTPQSVQEIVLSDIFQIKGHIVIELDPVASADVVLITSSLFMSYDYDKYKDKSNKLFIGDNFPSYIRRVGLDDLIETYNIISEYGGDSYGQ